MKGGVFAEQKKTATKPVINSRWIQRTCGVSQIFRGPSSSLVTISNPAARQIVRGHLHADAVANQDADAMLAHLARNRRQHHMRAVIELNFEECVRLLIDYRA